MTKRIGTLLIAILFCVLHVVPLNASANSEALTHNEDIIFQVDEASFNLLSYDDFMSAANLEGLITINTQELIDSYQIEEWSNLSPTEADYTVNSSAADLTIRNFTSPYYSEPFPLQSSIPFRAQVENIGTAIAKNIELTLYVDNTSLGTTNIGTLEPGYGAYIEISISSNLGGYHDVTLIVNEGRKIAESNYANNAVSKSFRWAAYNGICAFMFEPSNGNYEFMPNTPQTFDLAVGNFGETTVNNVEVAYIVNDSIAALFTLNGQIPPGYVRTASITIGFGSEGTREIGILVDPYQVLFDPIRSDNKIVVTVHVISSYQDVIYNRFEGYIPMFSTEHGPTAFNYTLAYSERYSRNEDLVTFIYRNGYATAKSNRHSSDTPYTITVSGTAHTSQSGAVIQNFTWTDAPTIFPPDLFFNYCKENSTPVTYLASNNNTAGFTFTITGSDAVYPFWYSHRIPLTIS